MNEKEIWLETRRKGLGGSDCGVVLGVNKYKSRFQLYLEKRGEYTQEVDNDFVYFGNALEDFVAKEFEKRSGKEVLLHESTMFHPEHEFMLANVDRLVKDENALLECKTASEYVKGEWDGDDIPPSYLCQIMHYLAVTGLERAYIAVLIGGNKFVWKCIERDEELIEIIIKAEHDFWYNHVVPGIPPEIEGTEAASSFIKELYPYDNGKKIYLEEDVDTLIEAIEVIKKDIKNLTEQQKAYENIIKLKIGENEKGLTDKYEVNYKSYASVRLDSAKIKKDQKEIYDKYGKESVSRKFTYKKLEDK